MNDDEKFGLKQKDRNQISSIFERFQDVDTVIIYGSRAKGNFKPYSDIDITLLGKNLNLTSQQQIENELDDLLLPYKFDVSIMKEISNPELIDHINRVGKTFYKRNSASH